jgi:hypothetical protein
LDRPVDQILAEWRRLERDLEAASDADVREDLQARIADLREEHAQTVADVIAHGSAAPPLNARA